MTKIIPYNSNLKALADMANVIRAIEGKIIEIIKSDPSVKLPKEFDTDLLA